MDMFIKRSIDNFKGLTSCNVVFTVDREKIQKKLRFYFSYIKDEDIFYIISLNFISMDKIKDWSKIEMLGEQAVVAAIDESISNQLAFFVAYYKDNFNNRINLATINRDISKTLNAFYIYMQLKSKINKSIKKLSKNRAYKMGNKNYEGMHGAITYVEI